MRTKRWLSAMATAVLILCAYSCQDWNEEDAPAGNQQIPVLTNVGSYSFESLEQFQIGTYEGGQRPEVVKDNEIGSSVLHLNGGYLYLDNPLISKRLEAGASATMWIKIPEAEAQTTEENINEGNIENVVTDQQEVTRTESTSDVVLAFMDDTRADKLLITKNAGLIYNGTVISEGFDGLTSGEWHYLAISISKDGYSAYLDGAEWGKEALQATVYNQLVEHLTSTATRLYIGYGMETPPSEFWMEDLKVYKDIISKTEINRPEIGIITIGATDFSTPFIGAFSDVISSKENVVFHYKFKNYTKGSANHENWLLIISNGKALGEEGYQERALIRADAYGWLNGNAENTIPNCGYPLSDVFGQFGSWEKFRSEMNGATVDMTVTRYGTSITMNAVITSLANKEYVYSWYHPTVAGEGATGIYLSVDNSYLEIENKETSITPLEIQVGQVGFSDFSTPFNTMFTEPVVLGNNMEAEYEFTNYTQGPGNHNNWHLVFTNGTTRGQEGYKEYAIIRADNWGWLEGVYDDGHTLNTMLCVPQSNYNWDAFLSDMNESNVKLSVKHREGKISFRAIITTKDNKKYTYYWIYTLPSDAGVVSSCLTVDKSYLVMKNTPVATTIVEPNTQLGASDFSTVWWTTFTPVITADGTAGSFNYKFTNHGRGLDTWTNWALVITDGTKVGDADYKEYAVIRADNYGWLSGAGQILGLETDLPNYTQALDHAKIDLTVIRDGRNIILNADITTESVNYYYRGTLTDVIPAGGNTIGTFLTIDSAYLTNIVSEAKNGGDEPEPSGIERVGETDFSTSFLGAVSEMKTWDGDGEFRYKFTNYTRGIEYFQNWSLIISNGVALGGAGYQEYALIRADNFGWLNGVFENQLSDIQKYNNYDWNTFKSDMQGATVDLSLVRQGNNALMKAIIKTTENKEYTYTCSLNNLPTSGTIGTCLSVDNAYLEINTKSTYVGIIKENIIEVGNDDCTTTWWGAFSPVKTAFGDGCSFEYKFVNHGSLANTWNNWVLVCSNGKAFGEDGYTEYYILRADNVGWHFGIPLGPVGLETNLPDFIQTLNGATINLKATRQGQSLVVDANITATDNNTYYYRGTIADVFPDATSTIGTFLTVDGSYLQISSSIAIDGN